MAITIPAGTEAPAAMRVPTRQVLHGTEIVDDYGWLRAENWQDVMRRPDALPSGIRAHLEAENAYTAALMAPTEALQAALFEEMKGRIKQDDSSVPLPDGPYAYASRYVEGGQHPLVVRTPRDGGAEEILLDGNALAAGKAFFKLGGSSHSTDHARLAWSADDKGSEYYTLRIRDLETGTDLAEEIGETSGGAVWANDGRTLFYVWVDDNHRPRRVYRHVVGTPKEDDAIVYEEDDAGFFVNLGKTQSGHYITLSLGDHETSETWVIDADRPEDAPRLIAPRIVAEKYDVDHAGTLFYIETNHGGAEDFKIVTAPEADPGRENWTDLVPHVEGRLLLGVTAYKNHLVRMERVEGLPRIVVRRLDTGAEHAIAFDEEAYSLGLGGGYEFDTNSIRFTYSSMTTPARVYDYDMETRARVLRKEQEVPSGHDPARYVTRRIQAPTADGETVPVSLLYRADLALDGSAPALLYGYGSYGITIPAGFSITALSLVERGFVYAIAHVRGGKDKGFRWYKLGRREHKANTFDDFVVAADALIAGGFTAKGRIVAQGGSAGGMLMGAIANRAPDRFAGIIAEVPFVDVLNTMCDATLPLTPPEWPEWGNPIEDEAAFRTILGYSPYENVAAQDYPPILAVAGLTDPRVTYWEPAKWVARLRATKTDANPVLLKTNMEAGHGGASGRFDRLKEVATSYAFALLVADKV